MNEIPILQNEDAQLEKLAAIRQLYADAKAIQLIQLFLSMPAAIILPILVAKFPTLIAFAALWGISITVIDLFCLTQMVDRKKLNAARIQESFDCHVLSIEWHDLHSGKEPGKELIHRAARRFDSQKGNRSLLLDWYPVAVGDIPIHLGRIICQRASCWWDGELRRRFSLYASVFLGITTVVSLLIGITARFTLAQFLLAVALPLLPLLVFMGRQIRDNLKAANSIDRLRSHAENVWKLAFYGAADDTLLSKESRDLQCEIFTHRKDAPLIPDWLYFRLRNTYEEDMNVGAEALIAEAKKIGA